MGETMIIGVIQVRMGSTRLKEKALKKILGKPLLWHIYQRVSAAASLDRVVIATVDGEKNQPIIEFAKKYGIDYYAGSEVDLVDRYLKTARKFEASALVRITGDCPLADPAIINEVVKVYADHPGTYSYICNTVPPSYPDGLDVDIFPRATLERLDREVQDLFWREWFTSYIRERPEEYKFANIKSAVDYSNLRWTVDYAEDLDFIKEVFGRLYPKKNIFLMQDILELLKSNPELAKINERYVRDAAYGTAKKEAGK